MPDAAPPADSSQRPPRIASIDALRGLIILTMIFVNDLASVHGAPAWLMHFAPDGDGMTITDIVFPAFLFIVGMSLPFSLGRQMDQGVPTWRLLLRIATRTIGLLIIGVLMVNQPSREGILSPNAWHLLMYVSVLLAWNNIDKEAGRRRTVQLVLRGFGIAGVVASALLYRGTGEPRLIELRTQWWGILGLIGWAYLVASLVFLATRRRPVVLAFAAVALYGMYAIDRLGGFANWPLRQWIGFGSMLGSHGALAVSGAAVAMMLTPASPICEHSHRLMAAVAIGVVAALAATAFHALRDLHPMFIINKNAATIPWCLWSTAWTVWLWAVIYFVMDVKGWKRWAAFLRPAGENPLFAYLLAPILYAIFGLIPSLTPLPEFYFSIGANPVPGTVRAVLFALGCTWLTGAVKSVGLNPKL